MLSFAKIKNGAGSELIAHKKNRTVSVILLGCAGLFYGLGMDAYAYYSGGQFYQSIYPFWASLLIYVVSLICLFNACTGIFKDMHDIPSADVQMSMPMNSTERYLSRLLSIFYIWLMPFLISAAFGFLVSLCKGNAGLYPDSSRILASSVPYIAAFNAKLLLCFFEIVLFIISVTVICQCCVGSKAESKYIPILVMVVVNFLPMALYYSVTDKFASVDTDTVNLLSNFAVFEIIDDEELHIPTLIYMVVKCLIYIGVIFCSSFIYKRRDARSVGRPIVFTLFFEIVMGLSLLLFFTLAHMEGFSLLAIFFAWLGSIILRIVVSRKEFAFKKILLWTGMFFAYYLAFLLFMFIAFKTGGFGALYKLPQNPDFRNYANVYIKIDKPERDSRYGWYSYSMNYEYEKEVTVSLGGNEALLKQLMEYTADAARSQSRAPGMYSYEMLDGSIDPGSYYCTVRINAGDVSRGSDDYYKYYKGKVYSIEFYMPADEKGEFLEKINSLRFAQ